MVALVAACSGTGSADVVFEEVSHRVEECPPTQSAELDCVVVRGTVVGNGRGTGSCTLYAAGDGRNIEIAAQSEELVLEPGRDLRWEVAVDRPAAEDFKGWNPRCEPMMEG